MTGKIFSLAVILLVSAQLDISAGRKLSKSAKLPWGIEFEVNGKAMFMGTDFVPMSQASSQCAELGMQLVSFASAQEYTDLIDFLRQAHMYEWFWTSGIRDAGSSQWYWSSNQAPIEDTFWWPGQPSDPETAESCLQFNVEPDTINTWFDKGCERDVITFICQ